MRVAKTYMQFLFEYLRTISINFKQKVGNLVAIGTKPKNQVIISYAFFLMTSEPAIEQIRESTARRV